FPSPPEIAEGPVILEGSPLSPPPEEGDVIDAIPPKEGKADPLVGRVPRNRIRGRMKAYLRSAYVTYSKMRHAIKIALGYTYAKRILSAAEHCCTRLVHGKLV